MVRSDSADEDHMMNEDGFDLIEEDEEMSTGSTMAAAAATTTTTLPVMVPEWGSSPSSGGGCAFDFAVKSTLRGVLPAVGHAPLLSNRSLSQPAAPLSPANLDPDRRLRRQIANCNERRRMQSINAGFMSLRALLPRKEGEKLSKAAILQQTADLINHLKQQQHQSNDDNNAMGGGEAKKAKLDVDDQRQRIAELECCLETERSMRKRLEQQVAQLRELLANATSVVSGGTPPTPTYNTMDVERKMSSIVDTPPMSLLNLRVSPPSVETSPMKVGGSAFANLESSVIRPTPFAPITGKCRTRRSMRFDSIEVSSPSLSTPSPLAATTQMLFPSQSTAASPQPPVTSSTAATNTNTTTNILLPTPTVGHGQPSAFVRTQSSIAAHHTLQTILDAIRHLEGGAYHGPSPPPPPTSQTSLVR
ncbi:unnamed protein product [Caenorhabditis bovis]|uniref:BHLH domain-containing protein n=1 Tax=Caenorhabditis bovis TaxID=2654633 RepID=A0A8S1EQT3_9PELO|nr:unnamed protein product [Caenorhabditis bovis]